jgi:hypothetical protein
VPHRAQDNHHQQPSEPPAQLKQQQQPGAEPGDPAQPPPPPSSSDESEPAAPPEGAKKGEGGRGLKRQYTLRSSPLLQNPFRDPAEEEEDDEEAAEPAMPPVTFEIVNTAPAPAAPPQSASGSELEPVEPEVSHGEDERRQHSSSSPIQVLQTITLSAEDLKRASTAKTMVE